MSKYHIVGNHMSWPNYYIKTVLYICFVQEEIRDLLSKDQNKRLELKERPDTGIYVKVSNGVNFCGKITFDAMYTGVKST